MVAAGAAWTFGSPSILAGPTVTNGRSECRRSSIRRCDKPDWNLGDESSGGPVMGDDVDIVIGRRLRARRRLLGVSQQALGAACGVTFQQIHKYESAVCRLSAAMLWRLSNALDVEVGYVFVGMQKTPVQDEPRMTKHDERDLMAGLL